MDQQTTTAADACPGVIVSSNRANDVLPYASHSYSARPDLWSQVFPWHFPQKASRDDEERFLHTFFAEEEIYMQGGADGDGRGFRFVKAVWYANAEWNLMFRVPMVEEWYWAQPESMSLLNDANMREFFFRPDVKPSTFFQANEMQMYGQGFLEVVTQRIQQTARAYLGEKELTGVKPDITKISRHFTAMVNSKLPPSIHSTVPLPSAPNVSMNRAIERKTSQQPAHATPSMIVPIAVPVVVSVPSHMPMLREVSHTEPGWRESQDHSKSSWRGDGHGGHQQVYNPKTRLDKKFGHEGFMSYGVPQRTGSGPSRAVSGGRGDHSFVPNGRRNPSGLPQHMQPIVLDRTHISPQTQHAIAHQPQFQSPQPVWYNPDHFGDGNFGQANNFVPNMQQGFGNDDAPRGGKNRRNSIGGRGGGFGSMRGRGNGRGRNSFGAADQSPHHMIPEPARPHLANQSFNQNSNQNMNQGASWKSRPNNATARNWRSTSDHPQAHFGEQTAKENAMPSRTFSGPDYSQQQMFPIAPPRFSEDEQAFWAQPNHIMPQPEQPPFHQQEPVYVPHSLARGHPFQRFAPDNVECTKDSIPLSWTQPIKLIAFKVPQELTDDYLSGMVMQWGNVKKVTRVGQKLKGTPSSMVFLWFDHAGDARNFLANRPSTWLDGKHFHVEVAREYWDPTWQQRPWSATKPSFAFKDRRDSTMSEDVSKVRTILRREEVEAALPHTHPKDVPMIDELPSQDTTPTPSGATTPKKRPNKNKNKNKNNRRAEQGTDATDSSKSSITFNAETLQSIQEAQTETEAAKDEKPAAAGAKPAPPAEVQSADEIVLSPVDVAKTQLPPTTANVNTSERPSENAVSAASQVGEDKDAKSSEPVPASSELTHGEQISAEGDNTSFRQAAEEAIATEIAEVGDVASPAMSTEVVSVREPQAISAKAHKTRNDSARASDDSPSNKSHPPRNEQAESTTGQPTSASPIAPSGAMAALPLQPTVQTIEPPVPLEIDTKNSEASTDTSAASPSKPKVTISIPSPVKDQRASMKRRSASGTSLAPPTPAFVTAPNTPALGCSDADDVSNEAETSSAKTVVPAHESGLGKEDGMSVTIDYTVDVGKDRPVAASEEVFAKSKKTPASEAAPVKFELLSSQTAPGDKTAAAERKSDAVEDTASQSLPNKKAEKAKGPAYTESFSMFAKKKEKKPKAGKKGTIKGKPVSTDEQAEDVTSGQTSRTVSSSNQLTTKASKDRKVMVSKKNKENEMPVSSSAPEVTPAERAKASEKASQQVAECRPSIDEGRPLSSGQETPSKSKGSKFGNIFRNIWTGGAPSHTPAPALAPDATSSSSSATHSAAPENVTTDKTEQDLPPKNVIKQSDSLTEVMVDGSAAAPKTGEVVSGGSGDHVTRPAQHDAETSTVDGLGIDLSSVPESAANPASDGASEFIRDNPDELTMRLNGAEPSDRPTSTVRTTSSAHSTSTPNTGQYPPTLRFGENDPFPTSLPSFSRITPTPNDQFTDFSGSQPDSEPSTLSPAAKVLARKLPITSNSNGHILEPKAPTWKSMKGTKRPRRPDPGPQTANGEHDLDDDPKNRQIHLAIAADTSSDDSGGGITPSSGGSSSSNGESGGKRKRMYVYVGPGRRSEMERNGRVERTKEEVRALAVAEVRRKFGVVGGE